MKTRTPSILFSALLVLSLSLSTGLANAQVTLTSPANGANLSSEPTFAWAGGNYDVYLFITVFYYDLGYWSDYYPVKFWLADTGFAMPSAWWEKVGEDTPCYWAVLGYNTVTHQWAVSSVFSFTKGDAGLSYLPDTGITECYDDAQAIECPAPGEPFYGQDAQYTTNPMRYTVSPDGLTVTDNVTGLMWQRCSAGLSGTHCSEGWLWRYYWFDAVTYCEGLSLAGYTDWGLPSVYELQGIVHYGQSSPAVDSTAFPDDISTWFWSSSAYARVESYAWAVLFWNGQVDYELKSDESAARCVRGESIPPSFTDNVDGTVTDTATGLMWQKCSAGLSGTDCSVGSAQSRNWEGAISYCQALSHAGHADWRLPDVKELRSIVDNTRYGPAIDTTVFPGTESSYYWSSSTIVTGTSHAWEVDFSSGIVDDSGNKLNPGRGCVRCVR